MAWDSGEAGGVNASRTSVGRSSHTSSQVATSLAPCLMSVFGPKGILVGHVSGHRKDVTILLEREASGDACAGIFGGFDDQHADGHAAQDAVANREVLRRGKGSPRKFGNESPAELENLFGEARVVFGVDDVDARAENRQRLPLAEIAPRWLAVSTPRAMPLIMTRPCAARSQARRSAIPEP